MIEKFLDVSALCNRYNQFMFSEKRTFHFKYENIFGFSLKIMIYRCKYTHFLNTTPFLHIKNIYSILQNNQYSKLIYIYQTFLHMFIFLTYNNRKKINFCDMPQSIMLNLK